MSSHFYAMLFRMKYIERWGLMRNTRPENLSEHSLETAFIAHALALIGSRRLGRDLDPGRAALLAMFHDAPEIITGDLPTPVKYFSAHTAGAYKQTEAAAAERLLDLLPDDLRPDYAGLLAGDEAYRPLIKAADKLSAYIKCIQEEKMGNDEFRVAGETIRRAVEEMKLPEADIFMAEFLPGFRLTLDELTGGQACETDKSRV